MKQRLLFARHRMKPVLAAASAALIAGCGSAGMLVTHVGGSLHPGDAGYRTRNPI